MGNCLVKSGFFVLRPCNARATQRCSTCDRPICAEHIVPEESICTECASLTTSIDPDYIERDLLARGGVYAYRRHYYSMHNEADRLAELDDLGAEMGFAQEDAAAFNAPSGVGELDDDTGFDDAGSDDNAADFFDS